MIFNLSITMLLQCALIFLAIRLIYVTGRHISWIYIAIAFSLVAAWYAISLVSLISGRDITPFGPPGQLATILATAFTALVLLLVQPVFSSMNRTEKALRESEKKYRDLYDNAPDMYYSLDKDRIIIDCNKTTARMLGYAREKIVGTPITDFMTVESKGLFETTFKELNEAKIYMNLEREFVRKDGVVFPVILNVFGEFDQLGKLIKTKTIARDITQRKAMEEKLRCLSVTDELTGLLNRRGFFTLADQQLKIADRNERRVFFLFADLDDLKVINDTYGHREGDLALFSTANILKEIFRDSDIIARVGGDEFAVLMTDCGDKDFEEVVMERIKEQIYLHNREELYRHILSISVGIVYYNHEEPCSIYDLVAKADALMFEHKKKKNAK